MSDDYRVVALLAILEVAAQDHPEDDPLELLSLAGAAILAARKLNQELGDNVEPKEVVHYFPPDHVRAMAQRETLNPQPANVIPFRARTWTGQRDTGGRFLKRGGDTSDARLGETNLRD